MPKLNAYSTQNITKADIDEVSKALTSDYLTQGPLVEKFEELIAEMCDVKYAVAISNATAGLHLSLLALGVDKECLVWTSPNSFVSSANAAKLVGAKIDFVDIDPYSWTITPKILEKKIKLKIEKKERLPNVIILVHFAGLSNNMSEFSKISKKYNIKIIEDAAHAFGSWDKTVPVGSARYSETCVFSFHAIKPITTGEGGVITTNSPELYKKLKLLRTHGITKNSKEFQTKSDEPWLYEQQILGLNYRITEFQCALGLSQIRNAQNFLKRRIQIVNEYKQNLNSELVQFQLKDHYKSANHILPILVSDKVRKNLFLYLKSNGIGVNVHYIPIYRQPYYANDFKNLNFPNMEYYYKKTISLPLHTRLKINEVKKICNFVNNYLDRNNG